MCPCHAQVWARLPTLLLTICVCRVLLRPVCRCIEYLKLSTSKGRSVSAGHVGPVADLMSSAPTAGSGQLLAIKGSSKPNQGKQL